jgi:hypothetical protein
MGVARTTALMTAVAVALGGCGISDPYTQQVRTARPAPAGAVTRGDHDGPPATSATVPAGASAPTPQAALARYGGLYVNWTAATLPTVQRRLASISTGQARAQALAESKAPLQAVSTYTVSNSGQVVAIAPGQGAKRGEWAVITDEQTTGDGPYQGLPATSHVTWAIVQRDGQGWVVSGWYPGAERERRQRPTGGGAA